MPLPLPDSYVSALVGADRQAPNAGLIFDRAPDHWAATYLGQPAAGARRDFLDDVRGEVSRPPGPTYLRDLRQRRERLLRALNGRAVELSTTWRLVSGLGATHVLENSLVWDRNLGIPYLPGSSIKGLIHAWAKDWQDTANYQTDLAALFGDTADLGAGTVVVHDAYPARMPELELDVMSVHAPTYYRTGGAVAPVDSESPIVVPFLSVKPGTRFIFGISLRQGSRQPADLNPAERELLDIAVRLLGEALTTLGIGSKTAVGYGHFSGWPP